MGEQWWEIEVTGNSTLEDLVFWELQSLSCLGTASFERDCKPVICGYIPTVKAQEPDIEAIARDLHDAIETAGFEPTQIQWSIVLQEDWANNWKDYWHTEPIGERFLIHPDWLPDPEPDERFIIRLDPGVAFGTGGHATTQLCIEGLERQLKSPEQAQGQHIADIGCGTGILGIAAILLGAACIYGVDTDELAVGAAKACCDLNGLTEAQCLICYGSVDLLVEQGLKVEGICCNILADIIIGLVPEITRLAKDKTWAIFSGILGRQAASVTEVLTAHHWQVNEIVPRQDWCSIHAVYG